VDSLTDTVTVPAGTFKDCIKITKQGEDGRLDYCWYVNKVGLVKSAFKDSPSSTVNVMELMPNQ